MTTAVDANILMQLKEISFDKLSDDLMTTLSKALQLYHNMFEATPPNLNHMKQSLEIAKSLGIDPQKKERSDESRLCFEAAVVLVLANRPEGQAVQYHCLSRLLREYPEFLETEEIEQTKLLYFRNLMAVSLLIIPANHNRAHLLNLITRLTEGRCVKYVTGSGAMRSTRRRVTIYEREGKIVPTIRPPRKNGKPARAPPKRKRKRELPPGCTNPIVTNTYNEYSLRLTNPTGEADSEQNQQVDGAGGEAFPMFIRIPTESFPVSSMKVPTSITLDPKDKVLEEEFHGFLRAVWGVGVMSSCYGWTGTLLETVPAMATPSEVEEVGHRNRARTAYMKTLELYYHISEEALLLDEAGEKTGEKKEKEDLDPYLQECFDHLVRMFSEATTATLEHTHREHIKILGLFFCLQRCTKRGLFQYFGEFKIRRGSDICLDFVQAVEVYFTMRSRLNSQQAPDPKSAPVMEIALMSSYARVVEIYFHLKCGVASGLLKLHQSSWSLVRESLYTEFYLMRQHALKSGPSQPKPSSTPHPSSTLSSSASDIPSATIADVATLAAEYEATMCANIDNGENGEDGNGNCYGPSSESQDTSFDA